jgi:hypothetical protein
VSYESKLCTYIEQISDEFHSTFSIHDDNTLKNMMGFDGDFENLTNIIRKYIPYAELEFTKSGMMGKEPYDLYFIRLLP